MENQNQQVLFSISVEGVASNSTMLNKEEAMAIYLLADELVHKSVLNNISDSTLNSIKSSLSENKHECSCGHCSDKSEEPQTNKVAQRTDLPERIIPTSEGNPFTHEIFTHKKVVGYQCPDCGRYTVRTMTLAESNETHCHFCRQPVTIKEVTRIDVVCPSCGDIFYVYGANDVTEIECKTCKSPIDVVYTPDHRHGKSVNLSR